MPANKEQADGMLLDCWTIKDKWIDVPNEQLGPQIAAATCDSVLEIT